MISLRRSNAPREKAHAEPAAKSNGSSNGAGGRVASARSQTGVTALAVTGRALLLVGLAAVAFVFYEFAFTSLAYDRNQVALLTTFKQGISATNVDLPTRNIAEGSPMAIIRISRIGVDQVVVEGTTPADLKMGPGHLRDTPVPGEFGNAVIAGRRTTYGAPFSGLDRLRVEDSIVVTTGQGSFVYVVSSVRKVPAGTATPLVGTLDSRLTLVTSDPAYYPSGRLVVVAVLQGSPIALPTRTPVPISSSDAGLSGDPVGLLIALFWAQLLVAATWLAIRLRRRLPRGVTLMFAVPTILALTLLAFSSLDLALPGTL